MQARIILFIKADHWLVREIFELGLHIAMLVHLVQAEKQQTWR